MIDGLEDGARKSFNEERGDRVGGREYREIHTYLISYISFRFQKKLKKN